MKKKIAWLIIVVNSALMLGTGYVFHPELLEGLGLTVLGLTFILSWVWALSTLFGSAE